MPPSLPFSSSFMSLISPLVPSSGHLISFASVSLDHLPFADTFNCRQSKSLNILSLIPPIVFSLVTGSTLHLGSIPQILIKVLILFALIPGTCFTDPHRYRLPISANQCYQRLVWVAFYPYYLNSWKIYLKNSVN